MDLTKVRKAVAGFLTAIPMVVAILVAAGLMDGAGQAWVMGVLAAATPLLVFLGIYKAKANTA